MPGSLLGHFESREILQDAIHLGHFESREMLQDAKLLAHGFCVMDIFPDGVMLMIP